MRSLLHRLLTNKYPLDTRTHCLVAMQPRTGRISRTAIKSSLCYVRNPPTSSHTPGSKPGCTIFVKLWQFDPNDRTPVRIDTSTLSFAPAPDVPGVEFAILYESALELVLLERWAPGISIAVPIPGGIELLVLDGSFGEGGEEFTPLSWLRLPEGAMLQATAGREGCKLWVKSGHLARVPRSPTAA
jgi:hypothetical protein